MAHLLARSQVTGDKLPDRLRSTSVAMLAVPTAIGLAFVAIVLQQGWPSVLGGPIPSLSSQRPGGEAASSGPLSVSKGVAAHAPGRAHRPGSTIATIPRAGKGSGNPAGAHGLSRGHRIDGAPSTAPGPAAGGQPAEGTPAAEPAESSPAATATPASAPAAAAASPASAAATPTDSPGHAGKGRGSGAAKHESHGQGWDAAKHASQGKERSAPLAPTPPELPDDEESQTSAPVSEGPGNSGHGHGYGHYK
jgi:hypothetical protein